MNLLYFAILAVGFFLLYWYGCMSLAVKQSVMFIGHGAWKDGAVGASFTSCTGKIYRMLWFSEQRSYSFQLSGHLQQGSVCVTILDGRTPVLQLTQEEPSGVLTVRSGQHCTVCVRFNHASGDYQLDWT